MATPATDVDLSIDAIAVAIALGLAIVLAPLTVHAWRQLGKDLSTLKDPREISQINKYRRWLLHLLVFVLAFPVAIGLLYVSLYVWSDLESLAQSPPEGHESTFRPTHHNRH